MEWLHEVTALSSSPAEICSAVSIHKCTQCTSTQCTSTQCTSTQCTSTQCTSTQCTSTQCTSTQCTSTQCTSTQCTSTQKWIIKTKQAGVNIVKKNGLAFRRLAYMYIPICKIWSTNHNCFVLRMGHKAVGPMCCAMYVKEPRTLIVKEKGLAPVFLDSRLEHPAGWICAHYKFSVLLLLSNQPYAYYMYIVSLNMKLCKCIKILQSF